MIWHSDGIKIYWDYYQYYLVEISGKKIPPKIPSIFIKNRKGIVWGKKMGETEVAADFQIWFKN